MIHLILAFLKKLATSINNLVRKIETKLKNMKTEISTDLQGLKKYATLKAISIDADGNYVIGAEVHYENTTGDVLKFDDPSKSIITLSGKAPDEAIPVESLTPQQKTDKENYNSLQAALSPVLSDLIAKANS